MFKCAAGFHRGPETLGRIIGHADGNKYHCECVFGRSSPALVSDFSQVCLMGNLNGQLVVRKSST